MLTHSKTRPGKPTHHTSQPFFSKGSTSQPFGPFFTQSLPLIQRKCAACEAEEQIQTKLSIGQPDDQYEKEADAVADRVVNTSDADIQRPQANEKEEEEKTVQAKPLSGPSELPIQRQIEPEEEAEGIQRQVADENEEEEPIQAKSQSNTQTSVAPDMGKAVKSTQGGGQGLNGSTRHFFETRFGHDFSDVRIHADSRANHLARSINARAFTHGRDIYFNSGQYQPTQHEGRHLLAHELTHVLQQNKTYAPAIQRACGSAAIGTPGGCSNQPLDFLEDYPRYRFINNCDTFNAGEDTRLINEMAAQPATARFEIHGYASTPGESTYNENLSCARALKAKTLITDPVPSGAGIAAGRIDGVFKHGESPGPETERRSVVITPPVPTPMPLPGAVPVPAASDFQIRRIGRSTRSRIFFAQHSHGLTSSATTQIGAIKTAAPASVRLIGFVSADESAGLAQDRADEVESALKSPPNAVNVASATANPAAMASRSDFVSARSVEVVVGAAAPTTLDCAAVDAHGNLLNPPRQDCTVMDPPTWTAFNSAMPIANNAMLRAVNAVSGVPNANDAQVIDRFFGNHDPATIVTLRTNLTRLQAHVSNLPAITQCGGQCHIGLCARGNSIAFNHGVDAASTKTLCVPNFKRLNTMDRARNLIHESAHGTSPLGGAAHPTKGTRDLAYRHERILFHLSTADRLRNSDSYALFALFLREIQQTGNPNAAPAGISTPATDNLTGFSTTGAHPEQPALELALAHFEKRLSWAASQTGQLYNQVRKVRTGALSWPGSWARNLMTQAAAGFPLTAPNTTPTLTDQLRVAAIAERYSRMKWASKRNLNISRMPTGLINWPAAASWVAGSTLQIGPDFFRATPDDQVSLLVEILARVTRDVETSYIPAYVSLAKWIHEQNT